MDAQLTTYYGLIHVINQHFNRSVSRSAKSQHLKKMREYLSDDRHSPSKNIFTMIGNETENWTSVPTLELKDKGLYAECLRLYNGGVIKWGNRPFTNYTGWEDIITFFNRNILLPKPLLNINQLKLYDKRLLTYIESNTLNKTTIYFLLFLLFYTE
tara:strand:+ start:811 stop:1278 length:468 start_codon:yes stop_codon:yes gene_type:complete